MSERFIPVIPDGTEPPLDLCPNPNFVCYVKDGYVNVSVQANGKEMPIPETQVPDKFKSQFKSDGQGNLVITNWVTAHIKSTDWSEFDNLIEGSNSPVSTAPDVVATEENTQTPPSSETNNSVVIAGAEIQPSDKTDTTPKTVETKNNIDNFLPAILLTGGTLIAVSTGVVIHQFKIWWKERNRQEEVYDVHAEAYSKVLRRDRKNQNIKDNTSRPGFYPDRNKPNVVHTEDFSEDEDGTPEFVNETQYDYQKDSVDDEIKKIRNGAAQKWVEDQKEIAHLFGHTSGRNKERSPIKPDSIEKQISDLDFRLKFQGNMGPVEHRSLWQRLNLLKKQLEEDKLLKGRSE